MAIDNTSPQKVTKIHRSIGVFLLILLPLLSQATNLAASEFSLGNQSIQLEKNLVTSFTVETVYDIDGHYWVKPRGEECVFEIKRIQRGWLDWLWGSSSDALPLLDVDRYPLKDHFFELHRFDPMDLPIDFFENNNIPGLNTCDYFLFDLRSERIAFCKRIPLSSLLKIFETHSKNQYNKGYSNGHSHGYASGYTAGYNKGAKDQENTNKQSRAKELQQEEQRKQRVIPQASLPPMNYSSKVKPTAPPEEDEDPS